MPPSNFCLAAPVGLATVSTGGYKAKMAEAKKEVTTDPYALKEHVKGEPAKLAEAKMEPVLEEEEMDVSVLRADTDEENEAVSESNLSDVQVVEEFPEVELEKTEQILKKMGKSAASPGMVELCDDIVMMLNPVTSTSLTDLS